MIEWGWNPTSVQAVGAVLAAIFVAMALAASIATVRAAIKQTGIAKQAAQASVKEIGLRMRPWVGIKNISFISRNEIAPLERLRQ